MKRPDSSRISLGDYKAKFGHEGKGRRRLLRQTLEIDPKKLLYFAAVIEQGSFNKAARVLGISQPSLSTSMSRLEAELGLKLMERGSRGVRMTSYGEMLYSHSRMIWDELDLAERNLLKGLTRDRFPIRFGCLPSLASYLVPASIVRWREFYPDRELCVVDAVQFDLLDELLRRKLDLFVGFTEQHRVLEGLQQRVLFHDRLCVVARPQHPLFSVPQVTLDTLVHFPWVFVPPGAYNMGFEDILEAAGIKGGNTVCESTALMKTLISLNNHLGLLPAHAITHELADGRLAILPFTIPAFSRSIAVFLREGYELDASSKSLIDTLQFVGTEWSRGSGDAPVLVGGDEAAA